MITSRLSSEGRTTIPEAVRSTLRLEVGDALAYEIVGQKVILTRLRGGSRRGARVCAMITDQVTAQRHIP